MKQTAMQVLKSKIQDAIGEINGELNLYDSGYKQCLINIQNDIDAQMMKLEKEQIIDAFCIGKYLNVDDKEFGEKYYNKLFKSQNNE